MYLKTVDDAYVNSYYVWKFWAEEVTPGTDYVIHAAIATKEDASTSGDVVLKGVWSSSGDAKTEIEAIVQRMNPWVYVGNSPRSFPTL